LVSLSWCIRQGTRGEGDGDADYLPPIMGSITGSLKSPCGTSCRSSIETTALNYFLFEKIAFLLATNRQT